MSTTMKYDVFISYSRKDTEIVNKVVKAFDAAGIVYFIDRQGIGGGMEFPEVIANAILASKVFLFMASRNSYDSKFTRSEVVFAFNEKQKQDIIPYIIDGSTLPNDLRFTFASINWRDMKQHPVDIIVADVLQKIGRINEQNAPMGGGKQLYTNVILRKYLPWIIGVVVILVAVLLLLLWGKKGENDGKNPILVEQTKEKSDVQKSVAKIIRNAVTDYDGNKYKAVEIGKQVWMAENLRTTHYANGESIPLGSQGVSTPTACCYVPNNDESNVPIYGYLYNWSAVMHGSSSSNKNPSGVQGICPNGWHVPSDEEWAQLTDYVNSQSEYKCGGEEESIAKALASTTGWKSCPKACLVGNDQGSNNATGFSAFPAGNYFGDYLEFGNGAYFWSATEHNDYSAYYCYLYYYAYGMFMFETGKNTGKNTGNSVRCVRD